MLGCIFTHEIIISELALAITFETSWTEARDYFVLKQVEEYNA